MMNPALIPALPAKTLNALAAGDEVVVYSGKHYGRVHRLTSTTGPVWTAIHEPSRDDVCFVKYDCEPAIPLIETVKPSTAEKL